MGGTSVATGSGVGYYESHALEGIKAAKERGYYSKAVEAGEPRAELLGRGLESLGLSIGAELTDQAAKTTWEQLRHPQTGYQLGQAVATYAGPAERLTRAASRAGVVLPESLSRSLAAKSLPDIEAVAAEIAPLVTPEELVSIRASAERSSRECVAFYDTLYTQDKSVSIAHAAADASGNDRAGEVFEEALRKASEAIVGFVDDTMYCRVGNHGKSVEGRSSGRYARVQGVSAAAYRHHTSRGGDMHDHVHVLVLNRAQSGGDDKFRALDGTMLFNSMSATTALASRASEMHISAELGLRWSKKADGSRYLAAVDEALVKRFSKRASAIEERLEQWADDFERSHGRVATAKERDRQHTNIQRRTRAAKPDVMESRVDAVAKWDDEVERSLSDAYKALKVDAKRWVRDKDAASDVIDVDAVIDEALDNLTATRTKFTRWHLLGEIDRAMPANLPADMTFPAYRAMTMAMVDQAVLRIGVESLTPVGVLDRNVPTEFSGEDGRSVFSPPADDVYAAVEVLADEAYLLGRAARHDAPSVDQDRAAAVVVAAGIEGDQARAIERVLASGRSLEVLVGPAGTGKSYTVAKLAQAWEDEGLGKVVGLAKSNAAATVLRHEGVKSSWNCDRWLMAQSRIAAGRGRPRDVGMGLRAGSLVVVDEASMADTATLVQVTKIVEASGGKVLLTGDHRQLASVGAGGFFELAADDPVLRREGVVSELADVRRFSAEWEGQASLRLRDGDDSVLEDYDRHGRIIEAHDDALAVACEQWVTDHLRGKDAVVVVASTEEASAASMKIRRELIELGRVDAGRAVEIANGGLVSVGDVIQARENNAKITDLRGDPVNNRDRLRVTGVDRFGALMTERVDNGRRVHLDPDYVAKFVELSYGLTAHGAQGRSVDTSYAVVSSTTDSATLYVAMTRGREANVAVVNTGASEDHDSGKPELARDARSVLSEAMGHRSAARSATAEQRAQLDASVSLGRLGPAWSAAVAHRAADVDRKAVTAVLGAERMARLDDDATAPAFWAQLAATKREGIDHLDALASTMAGREIDSADEIGGLLAWRLANSQHMAWKPARTVDTTLAPARTAAGETYLERSPAPESLSSGSLVTNTVDVYARQLAVAMDARVAELGRRVGMQSPEWATRHLGPVPAEGTSAREAWELKAGQVAGYREQYVSCSHINPADPIGPAPNALRAPERRIDWQLANDALGIARDDALDVSKASDRALRSSMERWEAETSRAPAYVRHELEAARREARKLRANLTRAESVLSAGGERSRQRLAEQTTKTVGAEHYVETLSEMHAQRLDWYEETSVIRTTAREAAAELDRRYPGQAGEGSAGEGSAGEPEELSIRELQRYEYRELARQQPDVPIGISFGPSL